MTNLERIKSATIEEIAGLILLLQDNGVDMAGRYCKDNCGSALDKEGTPTQEMCAKCLTDWLNEEWREA